MPGNGVAAAAQAIFYVGLQQNNAENCRAGAFLYLFDDAERGQYELVSELPNMVPPWLRYKLCYLQAQSTF